MVEIRRFCGKVLYSAAVNTVAEALIAAVLRDANLRGANLGDADLGDADLYGADLCDAKHYTPPQVLQASWGVVSDELCSQLMSWDEANHPNPAAFKVWASGGMCPYTNTSVERAAFFIEKRSLYKEGQVVARPYDLMTRVMNEKCPPWSEEEKVKFKNKLKK
jgi:hypothetical protein